MQRLSCYIIGDDSLPVRCGEMLMAGGHRILEI
jgi:hypothetical protein